MRAASIKISKAAALLVIIFGIVGLTGWIFNIPLLKSINPDLISMKVNTAIVFIISGLLFFIQAEQIDPVSQTIKILNRVLIAVSFIIVTLTLFEYFLSLDFGIDQILFIDKDHETFFPGRMAPNTAILFLITDLAIILLSQAWKSTKNSIIAGILGLILITSCLFSLADYPKLNMGNVLGNYNPMAFTTAFAFIFLGISILTLSFNVSNIRWYIKRGITIGFILGLSLVVAMSLFSNLSTYSLRETYVWVAHTNDVRFHISELSSDLKDVELNRQNYLLYNDIKYRDLALSTFNSLNSQLKILYDMTNDNSNQHERIDELRPLLSKRFDLLNKTFSAFQSNGTIGAIRVIQENGVPELLIKIGSLIKAFDNEEVRLLKTREDNTVSSTHKTFILLPIGAFASLAILVWIFILLNSEVTERMKSEEHIKRVNRLYSVLSRISHIMVQTDDKQKLFNETCRILVEDGKFKMAWIGEIDEKTKIVRPVSSFGKSDGYLDRVLISINDSEFQHGPTGTCLITGQYNVCNNIQNDPRMEPWRKQALKFDFRSSAAFPVKQKNKLTLPLTVYSSEPDFFDEDEIKLMNEISLEMSFALDSFDKEEIKKRIEAKLREASLYNRSLLEVSLDPLVTISPEGKIMDVNNTTELVTGVSREELIGSDFSNYFTDPDKANEGYQRVFSDGFVKDYPLTIHHKSGALMDVLYNASVYKNEQGEIQGIFAAARDITELKKKEDELSKLNDNLSRSNAELEQFAYVASHDLQEPLRMVASYTQLLEKRYKDKLDDDANDFIRFAVDGANRMQHLINDLLDYSRVTTRGKPFVSIDLSLVVDLAIDNLREKISESGAIITKDNLPVVHGDEIQLMRVFQNLIDNAIKFKGTDTPLIHINSKEDRGKVIISVSDNGIGIESKYKDKVFVIFQRLNSLSNYPGTGIGLAICKRTIERHGGNIWFESEPGNGTTFYFTLNKRK